jgi:hypothetical protein
MVRAIIRRYAGSAELRALISRSRYDDRLVGPSAPRDNALIRVDYTLLDYEGYRYNDARSNQALIGQVRDATVTNCTVVVRRGFQVDTGPKAQPRSCHILRHAC